MWYNNIIQKNIYGGGIMFQIGDQVFCPMRGSGIVEAIEEREMIGEKQEYFIIQMKDSNMTVMIPTNRMETSKFRYVSEEKVVNEVLATFSEENTLFDPDIPQKQRMKNNQAKLSSGTFADYGQVVRDLMTIQKDKPLNASENSILMDARRLFLDELSMIKDISKEEAMTIIDKLLA